MRKGIRACDPVRVMRRKHFHLHGPIAEICNLRRGFPAWVHERACVLWQRCRVPDCAEVSPCGLSSGSGKLTGSKSSRCCSHRSYSGWNNGRKMNPTNTSLVFSHFVTFDAQVWRRVPTWTTCWMEVLSSSRRRRYHSLETDYLYKTQTRRRDGAHVKFCLFHAGWRSCEGHFPQG